MSVIQSPAIKTKGHMSVGIIILVVVLALGAWLAGTYNGLVKKRNLVREGFATMDVYLKKRWDLVPNLVETVKGYTKHEQETLGELTKLRTGSYDDLSPEQKIELNQKLGQAITKIVAVAENYPDLKANASFLQLQADLGKLEDDIANSRKYYNGTVRQYNDQILVFPTNLIAGMFGFKEEKMFEAAASERENVKVNFS